MLLIASRWEGLLTFSQFLTRIVWPIQYVVDLPTQVKELAEPLLNRQDHLVRANDTLQHEQILLQAQVQKLRALEAENQELRELLKSASSNKESFSEARLIHTNVDPFMQQILLNKGKAHGIEMGQPVIDSFGLVGVVTGLNQYTSQVLLVTDPGFAVPIQSVRSGERAIASGSGSGGELRLNYVPRTADFIEGDILVTSGIGGRFPAGYPVGMITSIQHDPSTRFTLVGISPIAKLGQLRHVLFVKHEPQFSTIESTPAILTEIKNEAQPAPEVASIPVVVSPVVSEVQASKPAVAPVIKTAEQSKTAKAVKTPKMVKTTKLEKTTKPVKAEKISTQLPTKVTVAPSHLKVSREEHKVEQESLSPEPQLKLELAEKIATVSSEDLVSEPKLALESKPASVPISIETSERTEEIAEEKIVQEMGKEMMKEITKEIRDEQPLAVDLPTADPMELTP